MIRNLINVSGAPVTLDDFNGITIGVGETVDGLMFTEQALRNSADLIRALLDETIQVNDGTYTYSGTQAMNVIKAVPDQLTRDGKRIITSSDRPKDHYRQYTGCGDDVVNGIRGGDELLIYDVPAGQSLSKDVEFIDDIYLKDGVVCYKDAELGSYISFEIIAPANTPYPAIFKDGNFDYVDGQFVPNTTASGLYFIRDVDTVYLRFMHKMTIFGTNCETTSAPEPSFLPHTVKSRITIHNSSTTDSLKAVITLGIYRTITV